MLEVPDYKRKKFRKNSRKKPLKTKSEINVAMHSSDKKRLVPENNIKVVRGTKLKRKRITNIIVCVVAILCAVSIFLSIILPVSLYENIINTVALIGHGSYPTDINGSSVVDTVSNGSYYYVLSDTNITAYNNSGKKIFSEMHGFSNPIMRISSTRAIVFDQGGKNLFVYNLSGCINSVETKNEIINADISSSGNFAIVTDSESYTSSVFVYDKNCNSIYTWNSAKDIVNNVLLNSSGDKIAVSTLNSVSGQYDSKVLILNFKSADALYTLNLGSSVVLSLLNTGNGLSVVTNDLYKYIHWSKFTVNEIAVSGEINLCRNSKNGVLLVMNLANNRSDNTVMIVSKKGEMLSQFKINSLITDIAYTKNRVYYISDNKVNIVDKNGNLLRDGICDYGIVRFCVISSNSLATISDKQIIKLNIENGE